MILRPAWAAVFAASLCAGAKLPPPGVERVVCLEQDHGCSKVLKGLSRHEAVVRSYSGTSAKSGSKSVWKALPRVKAFLPHVVVTAFRGTEDYQALIDELITWPSGPRVVVYLPSAAPEHAAAMQRIGKSNFPKNVRWAASPEALLPAVRQARQKIGDGFVIRGSERTLEEIDRHYAAIPPVDYTPPAGRLQRLPRTRRILANGGTLRVVMLGDSIINDTSRSAWELLVERNNPKVRIVKFTSVRGGGGCWYFREPGRIQTFVLDHAPDLVIIGGISQKADGSIRDCAQQIRAAIQPDFFFMTGPFGRVDLKDEQKWRQTLDGPYRSHLKALAEELGAEYLDLQAEWARYVRNTGRDVTEFMRDPVHANERGEQILGRILERYFTMEPR